MRWIQVIFTVCIYVINTAGCKTQEVVKIEFNKFSVAAVFVVMI